ncbi:chemotaxis protein CheW [Geoalkalibacter halelectricus]|uniref:Chemotaxis protein CheW n=1 Tax=Geoalkalibacter halelectricus TaxID=2847045 RepID=A0ABY5ZNM3_9BACT|nr:chemotaxis protein CheW [Geoalkalibacter halelectricus]MDO3377584.1 chemotaxis protein CheW [Geoalkalibacter halelectricus]UWZ80658.1 chemotaxis protein CheW [Geoalkalibacter halelectricus]
MTSNQYLTFRLDQETFALEIGKVREIFDFSHLTRIPRTPDFMRGVINLRGNVVPVVDLRLAFGLGSTPQTVNTCIIISEVLVDGHPILLGALADAVQEVISLEGAQIEPAPPLAGHDRTGFIHGMGKVDEGFIIILDIDGIFSTEQLVDFQADASPRLQDLAV